MYTEVAYIIERLVKVASDSKMIGDLALIGAETDASDFEKWADKYDIPDSVVNVFANERGNPPGSRPEPCRSKALVEYAVRDRQNRTHHRG